MPGPFYNNIKGTTAGTPGTGAFTPNAASSGYSAWSTVPTGWWGMVRYEDGTDWELTYSYWNGTTLSRASTQLDSSSSGSQLSLTSAATATMVADGGQVMPSLGRQFQFIRPVPNSTTFTTMGLPSPTVTGTAAAVTVTNTNLLTTQIRQQSTSATTANAQAGFTVGTNASVVASSSSGIGGWEFRCRFGGTTLVTGQRMFCGMTGTTLVGVTTEPSGQTFNMASLAKDSTDTNFQFLVNSGSFSGTKTDTGIAFVANGLYDVTIWSDPGSLTINMLLCRVDTGAIWRGSTATDVPVNGAGLFAQCIGGLSSTTGTAFVLQFCGFYIRGAGA